jgi:hypothetical protein
MVARSLRRFGGVVSSSDQVVEDGEPGGAHLGRGGGRAVAAAAVDDVGGGGVEGGDPVGEPGIPDVDEFGALDVTGGELVRGADVDDRGALGPGGGGRLGAGSWCACGGTGLRLLTAGSDGQSGDGEQGGGDDGAASVPACRMGGAHGDAPPTVACPRRSGPLRMIPPGV